MPTRSSAISTSTGARANGPPPNVPCGNGQTSGPPPGAVIKTPKGTITVPASESPAQIRAFAVAVANQDYTDYRANFTVPPTSLMIDVGLWIALEATIGFIVGLGLASLMGQRTVPVILLIVLELILTPIFSRHIITHLVNLERGIVGVAMVHIEPGGLPTPFGGGGRRWRSGRPDADTGVDLGGVIGHRGLDRVLDGHRGLANEDQGYVALCQDDDAYRTEDPRDARRVRSCVRVLPAAPRIRRWILRGLPRRPNPGGRQESRPFGSRQRNGLGATARRYVPLGRRDRRRCLESSSPLRAQEPSLLAGSPR